MTTKAIEAGLVAMKVLEDQATADPENIFGADLTSLATACITAALASGDLVPASAVAAQLAAERERCAKVAKEAAAHMEATAKLHPYDSDSQNRCFARAREALSIEFAIRQLEPSPASGEVVVVPREPTEKMLDFGACYEDPAGLYKNHPIFNEGDISRDVYRAMLSAANGDGA